MDDIDKIELQKIIEAIPDNYKLIVGREPSNEHAKLISFLQNNNSLELTDTTCLIYPGGMTPFNHWWLSNWLIRGSRESGIKETIDNYANFLVNKNVNGWQVAFVDGVIVLTKTRLYGDDSGQFSASIVSSAMMDKAIADIIPLNIKNLIKDEDGTSVLISRFSIPSVFIDLTPDKNAQKLDEERKRKQDELFPPEIRVNFIDILVKSLTLIGKFAPLVINSSFIIDPSIPVVGGPRSTSTLPQYVIENAEDRADSTLLQQSDVDELKRLIGYFFAIDEKSQRKLLVPLERLLKTKKGGFSQHDLVSRFIDLGIVTENLLLESTNENMAEITFKICIRAARLLGNSSDERRKIYEVFNTLYALRSKAVHTGTVDLSPKEEKRYLDFIDKDDSPPSRYQQKLKILDLAIEYLIEIAKITIENYANNKGDLIWKDIILE